MSKFGKYFNSETTRGRANVAKATYASIAAFYLYHHFRKRDHKAEDTHFKNENEDSTKGIQEDGHHNTHDHKAEADPSSCPCKCDENAPAPNGHFEKGHNGGDGHQSNGGHHSVHGADKGPNGVGGHHNYGGHHSDRGIDAAHGNAGNHGHHNGTNHQQSDKGRHNTHGKSAEDVNYDQTKSLEASQPISVNLIQEVEPVPSVETSDKSLFSYMDDSIITWGLP